MSLTGLFIYIVLLDSSASIDDYRLGGTEDDDYPEQFYAERNMVEVSGGKRWRFRRPRAGLLESRIEAVAFFAFTGTTRLHQAALLRGWRRLLVLAFLPLISAITNECRPETPTLKAWAGRAGKTLPVLSDMNLAMLDYTDLLNAWAELSNGCGEQLLLSIIDGTDGENLLDTSGLSSVPPESVEGLTHAELNVDGEVGKVGTDLLLHILATGSSLDDKLGELSSG
jgi:hypothetical protein